MSPTQLTLRFARDLGWTCQVVEHWNPFARIRQDLFGCIDILALDGGVLGIQCTTHSNASARMKKAIAEPRIREWLKCGARFEVWGWHKVKSRWQLVRRPIAIADLDATMAT